METCVPNAFTTALYITFHFPPKCTFHLHRNTSQLMIMTSRTIVQVRVLKKRVSIYSMAISRLEGAVAFFISNNHQLHELTSSSGLCST